MKTDRTVPTGITALDQSIGGVPSHVFNVIESPNHQTGLLALGHFLMEGLKRGEKCTVLSLEHPLSFFESFSAWEMDFNSFLKSEQLVYLLYQPHVTSEIALTGDYSGVIGEIDRLASGVSDRVAFHQVDFLLNLQSHTLINSCVQKLAAAISQCSSTFLGQYVQFDTQIYQDVRVSFLKNMPGFFTMRMNESGGDSRLELTVDRVPWFHVAEAPLALSIVPGRGLVSASEAKGKGTKNVGMAS